MVTGPLGWCPVLASTVVVPDEYPTVQSAIDSGADTVLIRDGTYPERPIVDRVVVLRGIGVDQRPRLDGLDIFNSNFWAIPRLLSVSGIDFTGRVEYRTLYVHPRNLEFSFSACSLDSGIQVLNYDTQDVASLVISNSHLRGLSTAGASAVTMEADTVDGSVSWGAGDVGISGCWFRGGSGAAIDLNWGTLRGVTSRNRIEHYDTGISVENFDDTHRLEANVIRECRVGMKLGPGYGIGVVGNDIRNCGTGIYLNQIAVASVVGNTILNAESYGVIVWYNGLVAERNVIGYGGGAGLKVAWANWGQVDIGELRNNTIFKNAGAGMELAPGEAYVKAKNNIVVENGGWGVTVAGGGAVELGCNDLFGNGSGACNGVAKDSTDLSENPMFCNVVGADVRLDSASPLVDAVGCGQIGALGVGCGVTATLVQRFTAARASDGIRVVWQVADGAMAAKVWLERSDASSDGSWVRPLTERSFENRAVVELDRGANADRAYWYRLVALEGEEPVVIGAPIVVESQPRPGSRLVQVGPNPGRGPVRIAFALEHQGPVELDVFDVLGRRVASPARGVWPAGTHAVEWDGRTRNGELASAGVYLVRYSYPGGRDRRAIVRIR